ncbi:hypothetical protein T492DRAFT_922735, partial [Pavlovales sp. CCMP2436]
MASAAGAPATSVSAPATDTPATTVFAPKTRPLSTSTTFPCLNPGCNKRYASRPTLVRHKKAGPVRPRHDPKSAHGSRTTPVTSSHRSTPVQPACCRRGLWHHLGHHFVSPAVPLPEFVCLGIEARVSLHPSRCGAGLSSAAQTNDNRSSDCARRRAMRTESAHAEDLRAAHAVRMVHMCRRVNPFVLSNVSLLYHVRARNHSVHPIGVCARARGIGVGCQACSQGEELGEESGEIPAKNPFTF